MKRLMLAAAVTAAPILGSCVPMMALSAAQMVGQAAQGTPKDNEQLQPDARQACTAMAARYGTVNVIDVEQHSINKIIVWGTVGDDPQKRSFECDYGTKVTGFKLREIHPEQQSPAG